MIARVIIAVVAICVAFLVLSLGLFGYNIYRGWSDFTLRRTEVTEQIKAIYEFRNEHNHWPENVEEVGITLPPEWEYYYFEDDGQPCLCLNQGRMQLWFYFEESKGVWKFYVEGDEMKWSRITRPLPTDPQ